MCLFSRSGSFSNGTTALFFTPQKTAKHDGRCCPPCLLLEISGVCIDGYPLLTSRSNKLWWDKEMWSTGDTRILTHSRHVGGMLTVQAWLDGARLCFCSCVFAISDSWVQMALPSAEHTHTLSYLSSPEKSILTSCSATGPPSACNTRRKGACVKKTSSCRQTKAWYAHLFFLSSWRKQLFQFYLKLFEPCVQQVFTGILLRLEKLEMRI